jgi:excisionase family DNA binding protein
LETLLSVEEAARRLGGLSKYTVHAWLSQGRLRRTKVGTRTMISEHDLLAFIDKCNPQTAPDEAGSIPAKVER